MKILFNGESRETVEAITVAALLRELNLASQRIAVEVNLEVVPRTQQEAFALRDGDQVAAPKEAPPDIQLLTEIRDLLKTRSA